VSLLESGLAVAKIKPDSRRDTIFAAGRPYFMPELDEREEKKATK